MNTIQHDVNNVIKYNIYVIRNENICKGVCGCVCVCVLG